MKEEHKTKVTDSEWIREWHYSSIANVYCRYPSVFKPYKTKIHHQRVKQLGGEDYQTALARELRKRNLLDTADNSFALSFVALKYSCRYEHY